MAAHLSLSVKKVKAILDLIKEPLSLEMPVGESGDALLWDTLTDECSASPDESAMRMALRKDLDEALATLKPREAKIVKMRYPRVILDAFPLDLEILGPSDSCDIRGIGATM